ncbi:phage tail spike protein, partial [Anaerococcus sp. AGMB09787]|uniref:phage tail spike protein n=1 Tax=Anaerococcus sp. AGMB09787 TaxID=2922869 RepID=UPI001FAE789B
MIYAFDKNEKLIGEILQRNIIEAYQTEELNGNVSFAMSLPIEESKKWDKAFYLAHKDVYDPSSYQLYRILKSEVKADRVDYECIHVFFDDMTFYGYIRDKRPESVKATAALEVALDGSRWEVGSVDDSPLKSLNFYDSTRLDAISKVLKAYDMELGFRISFSKNKITHRYVDLYTRRGSDNYKRFAYGDRALEITREIDRSNVVTRLIPRGKGEVKFDEEGEATGGYGRRIQISDLDWKADEDVPVDKPKGQEYLELVDLTKRYGFADGQAKTKLVTYSNIEDETELLKQAYKDLVINSRPLVTFRAKVVDIGRVSLGDVVNIIRDDIDIRYSTRIFKIKRNLLNDDDTSVELGDLIQTGKSKALEDLKNGFKQLDSLMNESLSKLRENTSYISSVQDEIERGFYNRDGYNYELKAGNEYGLPAGYYSFDREIDDNPTRVIYVGAGTLAIANSKKSNGDWNFRSFGTGEGFVADLIIAGVLRGGKVRWNLEDGTFLIGSSPSDYTMYWDGSTLHFRNVDIDLENNRVIQELKEKYDLSDEEIKAFKERVDNANARIDEANQRLNNANARIDETKEDLEQSDYNLSMTIDSMSDYVDEHIESQDKKNEVVDETLLDLSSRISVTDGKIDTNIRALRESIEKIQSEAYDDSELRRYISENYSTITQTDSKIATEVSSVRTSFNSSINSLSSRISQTANDLEDYSDKNLQTAKAYADSKDSSVR